MTSLAVLPKTTVLSVPTQCCDASCRRLWLRLVAVDPLLNVVGLETEMTTDPVVRDRVAVTARSAPIDERLRDSRMAATCSMLR